MDIAISKKALKMLKKIIFKNNYGLKKSELSLVFNTIQKHPTFFQHFFLYHAD